MTRVLIADDHPIFREGLRSILERTPGFEVVGEVSHASAVSDAARAGNADVVLLGSSIPGPGYGRVLEQLSFLPASRALMFSALSGQEHGTAALRSGAHGYLAGCFSADELIRAIRQVASGGRYVPALPREAGSAR